MKYTVRSDSPQTFSLCEKDTAKSIMQNISLILGTKKGTIPMYREFGLPMAFQDRPAMVAETIMAAEILEAVAIFEPRATITDVHFEVNSVGGMTAILEVEI